MPFSRPKDKAKYIIHIKQVFLFRYLLKEISNLLKYNGLPVFLTELSWALDTVTCLLPCTCCHHLGQYYSPLTSCKPKHEYKSEVKQQTDGKWYHPMGDVGRYMYLYMWAQEKGCRGNGLLRRQLTLLSGGLPFYCLPTPPLDRLLRRQFVAARGTW